MSHSHRRIADLVEKYLEGSLDPRGRLELLGCLKGDADLRRAFLEQLDFSNLVSELYRADDFTMNTVERILWTRRFPQVPGGKPAPRQPRRRPASERTSFWRGWALLAAALLVAVAVVVVLGPPESGPAGRPRASEARKRIVRESEAGSQEERGRALVEAEEKRRNAPAELRDTRAERQDLAGPKAGAAEDPRAKENRGKDLDAHKGDQERIEEQLRQATRPVRKVEGSAPGATAREEKTPPAPAAPAAPSPGTTQASVARVEEIEGEVFRVTKEGRSALGAGADLFAADGLETGGGASRLMLCFADRTRVELGPETALSELRVDPGKRLDVARGRVRALVAKQPKDRPMQIATPHSQARVLGTTLRIIVNPDPAKGTRLDVDEGKVELKDLAGRTVQVESGHYAVAAAGMDLVAKPLAFWEGALAVYLFNEGRGTRIHDVSRKGSPLDLKIEQESCVRWLPKGLAIVSPTLVASVNPARKIVDACKSSNELTLEAWLRPATRTPAGKDGRIAVLSVDTDNQNFLLGQDGNDGPPNSYVVRFRSTATDAVGKPQLDSPGGTAALRLTQVVYSRARSGAAVLYVDGAEVAGATAAGNLSVWNDGYRLGLGNEFSCDRPWLGEYRLMAFYSRALSAEEVREHYRAGVE
jgi:hypothetical protein